MSWRKNSPYTSSLNAQKIAEVDALHVFEVNEKHKDFTPQEENVLACSIGTKSKERGNWLLLNFIYNNKNFLLFSDLKIEG